MSEGVTPNQRRAIEGIEKSCVLTAGAGSGKTRVLVSRYLRLITMKDDSGKILGPERIIAITFTEKAASEMRSRLESEIRRRSRQESDNPDEERIPAEDASFLLERLPQARIMTIDSFCMNLVRSNPLHAGVVADFAILSPADAKIIAEECVHKAVEEALERGNPEDKIALLSAVDAFSGSYSDMIGDFAGNLINAETKGAFWLAQKQSYSCTGADKQLTDIRDRAFSEYAGKLRSMRALDFAMVEAAALSLLRSEKGDGIRAGIKAVLVDEYQDTNDLQDKIVRLLVCKDEINMESALSSQKLFIVGDPNQSIYAFRGANPNVFNNWVDKARAIKYHNHLDKNFRSHPSLVNELNCIFKQLITEGYEEVTAGRSESDTGSRILVLEGEKNEEPAALARLIKSWVGKGLKISEGRKARYGDIALLVRSNRDCRRYTAEFDKLGIPFLLNKSDNIFASDSSLFLSDIIDAALDGRDPMLAYSVLASPALAISQASIVGLKERYGTLDGIFKNISLEQNLADTINDPKERTRLLAALSVIQAITEYRKKLPSYMLLQELYERQGFELMILRGFGRQGVANLRKIAEISRESTLGLGDIGALSEYIRQNSEGRGEISEPDILDSSEDAVKVMTVHAAKGLEFPIVVFGGANIRVDGDGKDRFRTDKDDWSLRCTFLESSESKNEIDIASENIRIVYVAMTRAMEYLVLTSAVQSKCKEKRLYAKVPVKDLLDVKKQDFDRAFYTEAGDATSSNCLDVSLEGEAVHEGGDDSMMERLSDRQYRFSPSSLMQFELCPKEYLRRYWYRLMELGRYLPSGDKEAAAKGYSGAELGTLVHLVCSMYEDGGSIDEVLEEAVRRVYGKNGANDELRSAAHALSAKYVRILEKRDKPQSVLKEVPFTLTIGNYLLEGAIDRIEQDNDGKWRVIDIKTNSAAEAKVEQLKEKYSLQMQVYSFVVGKLLGNVAMSELHFINCASNGDSVIIEPIPPISLEEAEKKLLELMDRVSMYVEQVRSLKSACERCDKRNGCWSAGLDRYEGGPSPLAFIEDSAISADDELLSELDGQNSF